MPAFKRRKDPASKGRFINPDIQDKEGNGKPVRQFGKHQTIAAAKKARINDDAEPCVQSHFGQFGQSTISLPRCGWTHITRHQSG